MCSLHNEMNAYIRILKARQKKSTQSRVKFGKSCNFPQPSIILSHPKGEE